MKVKVIFVKDDYATLHSEQVVDTGDGWNLVSSVPLPAPTPHPNHDRYAGRFPVRGGEGEPFPRVALIFAEAQAEKEGSHEAVVLDADESDESHRVSAAIHRLTRDHVVGR